MKIPVYNKRVFTLPSESREMSEGSRTVRFSVSSEYPVEDWPGSKLVLDHSEGSVDLERIRTAGPLLFNHDRNAHLGRVTGAEIKDGKVYVDVVFGRSKLAEEKFQDFNDGILREVSIGFTLQEVVLEKTSESGGETYRAMKWSLTEVSLVTVPADTTVGVGRSEQENKQFLTLEERQMPDEDTEERQPVEAPAGEHKRSQNEGARPVIEFKTDPEVVKKATERERSRVDGIYELARKYNIEAEKTREFTEGGKSLEEFQRFLLTERLGAKPVDPGSSEIGMNQQEREAYSLTRAMRLAAEGKPLDGLEKEAHDAMAKNLRREAKGFFIPTDVVTHKRDMSTDVASKGGYTVGTDVLGSSLVELLRNKTMVAQLGARTLSGLQGNIAIPTVEGGATAYWLGETEEVSTSDQGFGQIGLTPHRLVGCTAMSKQLLAQSSISVESFVREDLMRVLALAKDLAAINGSGTGGEPLGILSTTGINTVTFSAAATFAKMVQFETELGTDNADLGSLAYLTTPATRGKLKTKSVDTGSGIFVWAKNQINGYRAEASNQVPGDKVIFGNWADAVLADWDGMDVVVDPYSLKKKGQVEVCITLLTDFAVRHPVSFCASTDSGAQ